MTGHRERLIKEGLFKPLTPYDIAERNGLLQRRTQGEKIQDPPFYCVYRADHHMGNITRQDEYQCKDAELIADHLRGYEAHRLCNWLNSYDKQQPPRPNPHLPPLEMYRIANMEDWEAWEAKNSQLELDI